jgi:hypothetical protein
MDSGVSGEYYWCLRHQRVEWGDDVCRAKHRLGPFETVAEAERALATVRQRNEVWDAEDRRWHGEAD